MTSFIIRIACLAALAASGCNQADCTCALKGVFISSASSDLVGASGCGQAASCSPSTPCDLLTLSPPPDGGACTVGILFADGGTKVVTADFGAVHHSNDCCGDYFDDSEIDIDVQ